MEERLGHRAWRDAYAHPGEWDQPFAPLAMTDLFAATVSRYGDRIAADFLGRTSTYHDIDREARQFAAGLQELGLDPGDRVALFLPNVPAGLSAYFGALIAGTVVVPLNPRLNAADLAAQVSDSGARLMVTLDSALLLPKAERVLRTTSLERLVVVRLALQLSLRRRLGMLLRRHRATTPFRPSADMREWIDVLSDRTPDPVAIDPLTTPALIQYGRGTGGAPRGALLSHQNLTANARQIEAIDPHAHARDVIVAMLPLADAFANACVLNRTVCSGGMIALLPQFDAAGALALIERVRATAMPGLPEMFQAMLDHPAMARTDFTSLFTCIAGGAALPAALKSGFEKASGAKLIESYGLAEAAGVVAANPFDGREQPGSVGHPLPGTALRLLDLEDPTRDAAPDAPGELAVCGPQVMLGYWQREEATAAAFVERGGRQWLRTGDIAAIDEEGYVRVLGRLGSGRPSLLA